MPEPRTSLPADGSATAYRVSERNPRRWLVLGALCLSLLVVGLDATILTVALNDISVALGASTTGLQWVLGGYTLTFAALLIPAGVLGDRVGRGRVLAAGLTLFLVASAAAAFSTSTVSLVVARTVMGVGAAAVFPLALSILPTVFAADERPRAVAVVTAAMGLGMPLGPIVGGWLLDHYWWGATMLVNLPVVGVALFAGLAVIPDSKDPVRRRPHPAGLALVVAGLAALVYGIIQGPVEGWSAPGVAAPVVAGVALLAAFVRIERRSSDPLLDRTLLRRRLFVWPTVATALTSFVMLGLLFTVPLYLQGVRGLTALATGLELMPLMVALVAGAGVATRLLGMAGLRWTVVTGIAVSGLGFVPLGWVTTTSGHLPLLTGLAMVGFGFGLSMSPAMDAVLGALPAGRESTGTALNLSVKQLGGVFGVAVLGAVLTGAYRPAMASASGGLPDGAASAAQGSLGGAYAVAQHLGAPAGDVLRQAADSAFVAGMHRTGLVCLVAALATAGLMAVVLPGRAGDAMAD